MTDATRLAFELRITKQKTFLYYKQQAGPLCRLSLMGSILNVHQ